MVVLVTRAGSGIGRAVSGLLIAAGHRVYGGVSNPDDRARLQREGLVRPLLLDVTSPTSRQASLDRILMVEGRLDALVLVAAQPSGAVKPSKTLQMVVRPKRSGQHGFRPR